MHTWGWRGPPERPEGTKEIIWEVDYTKDEQGEKEVGNTCEVRFDPADGPIASDGSLEGAGTGGLERGSWAVVQISPKGTLLKAAFGTCPHIPKMSSTYTEYMGMLHGEKD